MGVAHTDNKECSNILNGQFHSVSNPKYTPPPPPPPPPTPLSLGAMCKKKLQELLDLGHNLLYTDSPFFPMQDIEISV